MEKDVIFIGVRSIKSKRNNKTYYMCDFILDPDGDYRICQVFIDLETFERFSNNDDLQFLGRCTALYDVDDSLHVRLKDMY